MSIRFIFLFSCYFFLLGIASGSDIPGKIALEKTAGIWMNDSDYGYYQVQVYRTSKSGLQEDTVKISEYSYKGNGHKPRRDYALPPARVKGLIGGITFRMIDGQRMLLYLDIETNVREVARIREVYMLSPGGKFVVMEEAQDMDNIPYK